MKSLDRGDFSVDFSELDILKRSLMTVVMKQINFPENGPLDALL